MSYQTAATAVGTGVLVGVLLSANVARADEQRVIVTVPDPSKETTITIKPFAAELSKKVAPPADLARPLISCIVTLTLNSDTDCSPD